tara:strand:+ start:14322 stop:14642 length:321 start_codon:yes stop_codon:yes gene_type:complete
MYSFDVNFKDEKKVNFNIDFEVMDLIQDSISTVIENNCSVNLRVPSYCYNHSGKSHYCFEFYPSVNSVVFKAIEVDDLNTSLELRESGLYTLDHIYLVEKNFRKTS